MAKAKKSAAKKSATKASGKQLQKALPPPDNPLMRHEELSIDRVAGGEGVQLTVSSMNKKPVVAVAVETARGAAAARAARGSETARMAKLRLAALKKSRSLPAPEGAVSRAIAETEPAGGELVPAAPGISNWVQMGPLAIPKGQTYSPARVQVTGRVTAIVVDPLNPQTIYLGAAQGGVWKTTDGGKNWVAKTDNEISLAIGALAVDPSNHLVLYAGTGEGNFSGDSYYGNGVLKTTDGGNSWATLATPTFTGTRFSRIAVTPGTTTRLFGATGRGLYRSTNGGTSWTQMAGGLPTSGAATDVAIDPVAPTTVYAAFWGQGIYKTTNAAAAAPTWTKLAGGLPASGFSRIALGLSPSSPQIIYALMADNGGNLVNKFMRTTNGGANWSNIPLPGGNIGGQGFYNLNAAVDPTTPDIVFLSGISVWKAVRNSVTGVWTITDIGAPIHPDNHAFAFDPANHLVIYAGNDGGIYKSINGGTTWSDTINEGPCITQFEFLAQHPTSDAVVFCGTQDNGTEQFRNSPVFCHADDGDGGYTAVDPNQPKNVISTYYGPSPKRSTQGGKFGTWLNVSTGIAGGGLFYPPLALDDTNPNNIAFGTDRINLDSAQGTGGWPTKVTLPGMSGNVSAIHYVNSTLIYAGTTTGKVYRLVKSGAAWTATAIHAAPLPGNWIWDVMARPDNPNIVIVAMSGFGISHVWRGVVPAAGAAAWTNISGSAAGILPDVPVNALVIDPLAPDTYYIATDVAVYRTTNNGTTWTQFSEGLPNCAVFDMKLHNPRRLLRVATHGRGMWERKLDTAAMPNADIFVRDHLMDTGRLSPSPASVAAAFEDPLQHVSLGDSLSWWMCADMKVDALEGAVPSYQMSVADVDYVAFESKLEHRNPQRGKVNRAYVQVHNRGIQAATGVNVKLLYANASAGLPSLPADFWTAFPGDSTNTANWKPIGTVKTIASLSPTEPVILEWDWLTPTTAADHSCLLVVIDSPANPIPAANKGFDVNNLVRTEKHVGLKNLHVVNAVAGASSWAPIEFHSTSEKVQTIKLLPSKLSGEVGLLFPKTLQISRPTAAKKAKKGAEPLKLLEGIVVRKPSEAMLKVLKERLGEEAAKYDQTRLYAIENAEKGANLRDIRIARAGIKALLLLPPPPAGDGSIAISIVQEEGDQTVGGSTFVLRQARRR